MNDRGVSEGNAGFLSNEAWITASAFIISLEELPDGLKEICFNMSGTYLLNT